MSSLAAKRLPRVTPERRPELQEATVVAAIAQHLADLGIEQAFGVSGGAIALLFDALVDNESITLHHFRHETGAAFAAAEAYFVTRKPSLVFATTGPGTLNALNGIMAARWDGAKVVLVSGATSAPQRGRWATQETSSYTMPQDALYSQGQIFDFAVRMENAAEFPEVARRLALGLSRPGRFIAHVCQVPPTRGSVRRLGRFRGDRSGTPGTQAGRAQRGEDLLLAARQGDPARGPPELPRRYRARRSRRRD